MVTNISPDAGIVHGGESASDTAAVSFEPLLEALFGADLPVRFEFWDGSTLGPDDGPGAVSVRSPDAVRRIVWAPGELGFARAFVLGDLDVVGPLDQVLRALQASMPSRIGVGLSALPAAVGVVRRLGGPWPRPPAPPEELVPHGRRHTLRRDRRTVSHHYDVGNDFYELVLGASLTYSCAYFETPEMSLHQAQDAKHELICRKLGLAGTGEPAANVVDRPRLLDVGCGWGSMALHAAQHHGADVVGVTLSREQADRARDRVARAGLTGHVEIRVQDYRDLDDGPFDAISSIGMAEHVGAARMSEYFSTLHALLRPQGRLLNHAIASIGGSRMSPNSFIGRYVFPDGELLDLGDTILGLHAAGFEVRDVENLREHYARTLRQWVANLQARWADAERMVGERRARAWLLYMSGSINGFDDAGLQIHQTLALKNDEVGRSAMPATRNDW